ncbi:hypothetical protein VIGAN_01488700 [Vigna angularis var. angularis]|uniref:Uncharacterized protein n=1 Tax=Vigna angularis var. angularis TaxID=157739 RepID=A0A0S3R866_PHAAN|nr:hypothetical protein VIGAN_01488700 [Vigna angularis var. angularis]
MVTSTDIRSVNLLQPKEIDITIVIVEVLYEYNLLASVLLQSHVKQGLFFQKPLARIFPQHVPMDTNWGKTRKFVISIQKFVY